MTEQAETLSVNAAPWRLALACPACRGDLRWSPARATCRACGAWYEVIDDIPILVPGRTAHSEQQASFFDTAPAEWEIRRPHGATRLYRWLIEDKFRRSIASLRPIAGTTTLTVCGGSGMDAEFLARSGASVCLADISLGAAKRARERARRRGFSLFVVVADAEALPFGDRSIDVTYVHDGLHHLERPIGGLDEMARVARRAVSVNEPAQASLTMLAVRVGLSQLEEEAGNRIGRLRPEDIVRRLEECGFAVRRVERYGMVYRHEAGRASRWLSLPGLFTLTRGAVIAFNRLGGRTGNKLTVQAVRLDGGAAQPGRRR
jgi:uncharacterized protein YbaR (Trm112 family)